MAHYAAAGVGVTLVTCTLGERGEILVPEWEHFSEAELGQHRVEELKAALAELGVSDHVWLGGQGKYHDTGMVTNDQGWISAPEDAVDNAFWKADLLEAALDLVPVIRDRKPQVLITYDPFGGYGHPDHIQAHRVAMYAAQLASASYRPDLGEPWQISRILWSTHHTEPWQRAVEIARQQGISLFDGMDSDETERRLGPDPALICCIIPVGPWLDQAQRALDAHRSQVRSTDDFWRFFAIMRTQPGAGEAYLFASGVPMPAGGIADDVFAGLGL